jgi:hypothetical protein
MHGRRNTAIAVVCALALSVYSARWDVSNSFAFSLDSADGLNWNSVSRQLAFLEPIARLHLRLH